MHCWARYLLYAVIAVLGTGQLMTACGQKGPLYLPEPEPEAAAQPAPQPVEAIEDQESPAPGADEIPSPTGGLPQPTEEEPPAPAATP
jgi:predicted small lipoprotein YifL